MPSGSADPEPSQLRQVDEDVPVYGLRLCAELRTVHGMAAVLLERVREIQPTGREHQVMAMDLFRIEGDRIVQIWTVADYAGLIAEASSA